MIQPSPHNRSGNRPVAVFAALLLPVAALLSACDGSDRREDPLNEFKRQTLAWSDCDADTKASLDLIYPEAGALRIQCTQMRAPRDYAAPESGEVTVGMLRVKALAGEGAGTGTAPEPMLFNPGGPGGDGYLLSVIRASQLDEVAQGAGSGTAATRQMALKLLQSYDLIGFSPRGTGHSTRLKCESAQQLEPVDHSLVGRIPSNIRAELANIEKKAEACASNPLTPFINSDATARDMDLMREVLGGKKLHFYGASYGTWLGLWYASVFPQNVGRMVLDSNMDFTSDFSQAGINSIWSMDRTFKELIAPYAAGHPGVYGLGNDAQAIRDLPGQLPAAIRSATARQMGANMNMSKNAPFVAFALAAGRALSQPPFVDLWPLGVTGGDFAQMDKLIDQHRFADDAEINGEVQWQAKQIMERVVADLQRPTVSFGGYPAVYKAVVCNDMPSASDDPQWWSKRYTELYETYPLADLEGYESCLYWKRPAAVRKPSLSAMKDLDVMLVQSQYDVPTPHENARAVLAQLPKSHMVYVTNEMNHGVFPYSDECVDSNVLAYLLGSSPKDQITTCTGRTIDETRGTATQKSGRRFERPTNLKPDGIMW